MVLFTSRVVVFFNDQLRSTWSRCSPASFYGLFFLFFSFLSLLRFWADRPKPFRAVGLLSTAEDGLSIYEIVMYIFWRHSLSTPVWKLIQQLALYSLANLAY